MKKENILIWGLTVLFSVLMSVPFIIPHTGFLALIGIVPLLCMERIASMLEKKRIWIYHYSAFVLWNAIMTFWVCNATVGGGLFAIFANAFQMSLIFGLFRLSKKRFSGALPYIFLALSAIFISVRAINERQYLHTYSVWAPSANNFLNFIFIILLFHF